MTDETVMVKGRYLGSEARGGEVFFVYEYDCPRCHIRHKSTSDELSAPALCHGCFTGQWAAFAHGKGTGGTKDKRQMGGYSRENAKGKRRGSVVNRRDGG